MEIVADWSLNSKAVLSVGFASLLIFIPIFIFSTFVARESANGTFIAKATAISQLLESHVSQRADFADQIRIWEALQKITLLNPDVLWIDVNELAGNKLTTVISIRPQNIGQIKVVKRHETASIHRSVRMIIVGRQGTLLKLKSPIHSGKRHIGIFEMCMTLETVDDQIQDIRLYSLLSYIALMAVFAMILLVSLRVIVIHPINQLVKYVRSISAGDFEGQEFINRKDEIGALAESLQNMTAKIRARDTALEAQQKILQEAVFEARMANNSKSEFVAMISHELRTPLNAILGFSEAIRNDIYGATNPEQKERLDDIHSSGSHLLNLINDILDLSKIEAGKLEPVIEDVDVKPVFASAHQLTSDRAIEKDISLTMDLPSEPMVLRTDERYLLQILINLLSNAVKFTTQGGSVVIHLQWLAAGELLLEVRDTGVGIKPQQIPNVLAPFGQVEDPMTRNFEGTGLGLSLVEKLVELLEGEFELESVFEVGTTARVIFPAGSLR